MSCFTFFQIMTLESWSSGIARPMMEVMPYSYVFFVPFILRKRYKLNNISARLIAIDPIFHAVINGPCRDIVHLDKETKMFRTISEYAV